MSCHRRHGRLMLPKAVREAAGLRPGAPLKVTASKGHTELKRVDSEVRLVRQGRLTVAVAEDDLPPIKEREILALREELLDSRAGS